MKKPLFVLLIASILLSVSVEALAYAEEHTDQPALVTTLVKLSSEKDYADVSHMGHVVRIMRNQDLQNLLEKNYTRTSRPCPPFCIQPIEMSPGIKTLGELEIIDFLQQEVEQGEGLLVDVRMPRFYDSETIPGAVNIPFLLLTADIAGVLPLLGASRSDMGWNFQNAKTLLVFCNGPWCSQSERAVSALIKVNYPKNKLRYYRGGMQMWKLMGLSTISAAETAAAQ